MNKLQANIALVCVTLCWSTEVIIFSNIPDTVAPFATTCITNLIAAALLFASFFKHVRLELSRGKAKILKRCLFLGVLNCAYNLMFLYGLKYFNVTMGAFTFSMTVVIIPIVLLTMRQRVSRNTWISVILVTAGICVALGGEIDSATLPGFFLMATGCALRAIFIIKLNSYAREHDPVALSSFIAAVVALTSFVIWTFMDPATFANFVWTEETIASLFIYAYFVIFFAQTINVFAQRKASAAGAAVIYSLEIVFSVIWGATLPGFLVDRVVLTPSILIGCALVVAGSLVTLADAKQEDAEADTPKMETAVAATSEPAHEPHASQSAESDAARAPRPRLSRRQLVRGFEMFLVLLVVYLILAIPFKVLMIIPGFADVRPVVVFQAIFGIFFGFPGALAYAVGNLIGDIASDSLRWSSIAGFAANFIGPYLFHVFASRLRHGFSLRTRADLGKFLILIVAVAVLEAVIISPVVELFYPEIESSFFGVTVVANAVGFPFLIGIPMIILMQEELGFRVRPWGGRMDSTIQRQAG